MDLITVLRNRRSIREFTSRQVTRTEIDVLLDAAVTAPNHRLTQPWRFYLLGPEARRGLGVALGNRRARKIEDAAAAAALRGKVTEEYVSLPLVIAVAVVQHEDAEVREEDYAAGMMAVLNISLAAVSLGLGTHIKTGAVMEDPAARTAIGVRDGERVIAMLEVGEPATVPAPKARQSPSALTTWVA